MREEYLAGQLSLDEEVRHFKECRLLRQFLDGIAAVAQDTVLPIDEGDL